ncbi:hypothetical protein [Geobacter sp.]|uniref:hypothetical protein n=1 Tax=Geobacter sp. TaxID=46610 RepID=UPI002620A579|nr:hypothetical protein [Geobacter sp.]
MIAKLAEGETPDIDPAECTSGNQSFSALITKALKEGNIDYQDPSALLKKMTRTDNARVRDENKITATASATAKVIPFPQPEPPTPPVPETVPVIVFEGGWEVERQIPAEKYHEYLEEGMLEVTLFGTYLVTGKRARRGRA